MNTTKTKTYANKSNARRSAIAQAAKTAGVSPDVVKENADKFFKIEGDKTCGFYVNLLPAPKKAAPKKVEKVASPHNGKGLQIEKNRPEKHGVKRPSVGGKCRAIWDYCDDLHEQGIVAMPKLMKKAALEKGWNEHTVVIQLYEWKKYHGLVGSRSK